MSIANTIRFESHAFHLCWLKKESNADKEKERTNALRIINSLDDRLDLPDLRSSD